MADPATLSIIGATVGAATNKDDPVKGAIQGAALFNLGGAGIGAMSGAGAAAGAAEGAGLLGADAAGYGSLEGFLGAGGIDSSLGAAYQAAGMGAPTAYPISGVGVPELSVMPDQAYAGEMMDAAMGRSMPSLDQSFDYDTIARSSMGSDIPGASSVSGSSPYGMPKLNPMMAMQAMNLTKPQEQPMMMRGGVTRGDPRAVQQDAVLSLLAPKRLEKRKISLLG